jgi:hypothetical protein
MESGPSRRKEKKSKCNNDKGDRGAGHGAGDAGGEAGDAGHDAPEFVYQQGPIHDGGSEGKTMPAVGVPRSPPSLFDHDNSYQMEMEEMPVRRDAVIYDNTIERDHHNYHNMAVQVKLAREANPYVLPNDRGIDYHFWSVFILTSTRR